MPISKNTIVVSGLQDVNRAFGRIDRTLKSSLTKTLKSAGEPVRAEAERLGPARIRNLHAGDPWSKQRVGVTQRTVYVTPTERGRGRDQRRKRPNFKALMLDRSYEPALESKRQEVIDRFGHILDDVADAWGA